MPQTHYPQFCALARAAEIVGERWTLLIVRELLLGPKRFGDLVERLGGVSPTVLTGRLNGLVESGVVQRAILPAPFNAQTYALTPETNYQWNKKVFNMLYQLFQMTVSSAPTASPQITIAK